MTENPHCNERESLSRIAEMQALLSEAWNLGFIAPIELDDEHVPKYRRDDIKALLENWEILRGRK